MGVVYRARDPRLNRDVAVKLIPPSQLSAESEQRFEREAQLVAQMDHPSIVPIYDFGRHDDALYFVMALVQGTNLRGVPAAGQRARRHRRHRHPGRRGPRLQPRARRRPPRHQARKHHGRARGRPRRPRARDGLRAGPRAVGEPHDAHRHAHGHARVPEPGADHRPRPRRPLRHLRARHGALRVRGRRAAVHRRGAGRRLSDRPRVPAGAARTRRGDRRGARADHHELPAEGAGEAAAAGGRGGRGASALSRAAARLGPGTPCDRAHANAAVAAGRR